MKTMLATGSTPVQVGSARTQMGMITAMRCYVAAATEMGYDVDWRPVTPGEDLSRYDAVIAAVQKPNSIASRHFYGVLWALSERLDAVAVIDDWQSDSILAGAKTYAASPARAFRLRGEVEFADHRERVFDYLTEFARGDWRFPVVVPTLGRHDVSMLGIPAEKIVAVDPTPFSPRYSVSPGTNKSREWVRASLMTDEIPSLGWPVSAYGAPDKGKGGVGRSGAMAQPRVREDELATVYSRAWGVLSPPHPHAGSGWWRVRYLMAADAGCVLSGDAREATCLGLPYVEASDPGVVESMNDDQLRDLARRQRACLAKVSWTKTRTMTTLSSLFAA